MITSMQLDKSSNVVSRLPKIHRVVRGPQLYVNKFVLA